MIIRRVTSGGETVMVAPGISGEESAMVQALYSRSVESAERHLRALENERRARVRAAIVTCREESVQAREDAVIDALDGPRDNRFMSRWYVGYGHKSIGDCGSMTFFVENVSMLAAKAIQATPLYSGQETSTRYMDMAERPVEDPIDTYASLHVLERWMEFYREILPALRDHARREHPRAEGETEEVYERAVAARAFDVARAFLPAGATTQLGWHTNLRQAADHLPWLLAHPLAEVRRVGGAILSAAREASPSSFGGEATGLSGVGARDGGEDARRAWREAVSARYAYLDGLLPSGVIEQRVGYGWPDRFTSGVSNLSLTTYRDILTTRPRGEVLPHWMTDLGQISLRFPIDFGSWRDLQRHRNGVCRFPLLATDLGFHPWYLEALPPALQDEAVVLLAGQTRAIDAIDARPEDKQYLVPMGFRVPARCTYGLPALVYVLELRSSRFVHPTLRREILTLARELQRVHPLVALHLDEHPSEWDARRGRQTIAEDGGEA